MAGFTGMVMAARGLPAPGTAMLCGAVLLLAAAGSAMINSVLDFPLDCKMSRLTDRIRALEKLGQTRTVLVAVTLITAGVMLALVYLNLLVTLLTLTAAFGYLVPYTLRFKRTTPFGAIPGAIPGALPVLIGYGAIRPAIGPDGTDPFPSRPPLAAPPFLDTCAPLPGRLSGRRSAGPARNPWRTLYENLHFALRFSADPPVTLALVFRLLHSRVCRNCAPFWRDLSCRTDSHPVLHPPILHGFPRNQQLSITHSSPHCGRYLSSVESVSVGEELLPCAKTVLSLSFRGKDMVYP